MKKLVPVCVLLLCVYMVAMADGEPRLTHVCAVAPDILALTVDQGTVEFGKQVPYVKQDGDECFVKGYGPRMVRRGGTDLGGLVGDGTIICLFDKLHGEKLDVAWAAKPASYDLTSTDDPEYKTALHPTAVYRKSRPTGIARVASWAFQFPVQHTLYLRLPKPLVVGKTYALAFEGGKLSPTSYTHQPEKVRSEAVHVTQVGFRPDDTPKEGYLSCWLGDGGVLSYPADQAFSVIDESGKTVFEGKAVLSKAATQKDEDPYKRNYNHTDVYRLDFSSLTTPGTYRVVVAGIGCSYPFTIGPEVWRKVFNIAARGFYHERSGNELKEPYTSFKRPRSFHPDDGVKVYASKCPLINTGNGLNRNDTNFGNLVTGMTDEIVPNAWGGYFDAGDWDRRIQHLEATRLLLELAELFPDYMKGMKLNIPESGNGLPDIVNEAMWNIDCYRRMQTADGGIRGGIESAEHPRYGEGSWQESLPVMAYAPDAWSSYLYAATAAQASGVLKPIKPELAETYLQSALKAMDYAEKDWQKRQEAKEKVSFEVRDARNLAAAQLFRQTGDKKWNDIFVATTVFKNKIQPAVWNNHNQRDAAFTYVRTNNADINTTIQENARASMLKEADVAVNMSKNTGFGWTKKDPWEPMAYSNASLPQALTILRAHALTGKSDYLEAAIRCSQLSAGANPQNMCFTTGVGYAWPRNILWIDSRVMGVPPPPGLTVFGAEDPARRKDDWSAKIMEPVLYPELQKWPAMESYFDIFWSPMSCEFVVNQTMGPNTYAWGYLAARK